MAELDPEQTDGGAGAAAGRLRDVQAVSEAALAHLSLDDLLEELLERVQAILEVDTVAVLLLDRDAGEVVARAARGLEEEVRQGSRIPLGRGFAGRIAAEKRPIVIRDIDKADVVNPILRERGVRSLLGVPLLVEGRSIGVMHVGSLTPREFDDTEAVLLQLVGDRVAVAIDRARLLEAERQAREEAEASTARLVRLESLTEAALSELSLDELLDELLTRLRRVLNSDTATVLLLDKEADELVAYAAKGVEEEARRRVRIPVGRGFAGRVAAEARPVVIPDVGPGKVINPILLDVGIRSLLGVPLLVEGEVIGVLHVGTLTPRDFGDDDIRLLQLAADRIALAIERARLFDSERHAREDAERSADLIARVQSITEVALTHLALDDTLLNEMLARVRDGLEVDTAAILTLDREANELVARAARGLEEEVERGMRVPVGGGFAGRIAATGKPVVLEEVRHTDVLNPVLRLRGIRSLLGVPLLIEGRVIGVLHVGSLTPRSFTDENVTLLQMAADRIAVALDRARLSEREHLVAVTLQRSLLPDQLPRMDGLQLAARYRPGEGETEVGGDWYDAIVLPSGNVGIAIGDVVTRGLRAASVTAQLRNALRAYVLEGHSPGQVMSRLGRLTRTLPGREMATLLYMEVEASSGRVTASTAGHPPPLVIDPDGGTSFLDVPPSVPLGALAEPAYGEVELQLTQGCQLIAYTDGLVERRNVWLDEGMERLREAAMHERYGLEALCDHLLDAMLRDSPTDDDLAVLALELADPAEASLTLEVSAEPRELAGMRRSLRQWLNAIGADPDAAYELLVATTEAAANSVEHAYGPGDATFSVEALVEDDHVAVVVRDGGRWRPPRGANRGRGTLLMQEFMDNFEVVTGDHGTEVRLRRRVRGPEFAA